MCADVLSENVFSGTTEGENFSNKWEVLKTFECFTFRAEDTVKMNNCRMHNFRRLFKWVRYYKCDFYLLF